MGIYYISRFLAEKHSLDFVNDPRLAEVDLKVPNFDAEELDAQAIDQILSDQKILHGSQPSESENATDFRGDIEWGYSGANGPGVWHQLSAAYDGCQGRDQSPVDLPTASQPDPGMQPLTFLFKNLPGELFANKPVLTFKPVQGHSAILFDETYYLKHVEFHIPSEHHIDGLNLDMEVQFYHRNVAGQWAVVAVLARESRRMHEELKKIIAKIPKRKDQPSDLSEMDLAQFLPAERHYLHYQGSFTSPPCTAGVRWLVMTTPIVVSDAQIDALSKIMGFSARPLQPLDGRTVDKSWR